MARFAKQRKINRINVKHVEDDLRDARKGTEVTVKLSSHRYRAEIVNLLIVNNNFGYFISSFCQGHNSFPVIALKLTSVWFRTFGFSTCKYVYLFDSSINRSFSSFIHSASSFINSAYSQLLTC